MKEIYLENDNYIIYGLNKALNKTTSGDFIKFHIEKDQYILLCLADGVGSKVCDFEASAVSCNAFIDSFINQNNSILIVDRFEEALRAANELVCNPLEARCKGMMSTLVAVYWDFISDEIYFASIGDSRLYLSTSNLLKQISTDQKVAVMMKDRSGKILTQNGSVIIREGITNGMGTADLLLKIEKAVFKSGDALLLASDGFYDAENFHDLANIGIQRPNIKKVLTEYYTQNAFKDDSSCLILVRTEVTTEIKNTIFTIIEQSLDYHKFNIASNLMVKCIEQLFLEAIDSKNEKLIISTTDYVKNYDELTFSEQFINSAILEMKHHEFVVPPFLNLLIKHLKKLKF